MPFSAQLKQAKKASFQALTISTETKNKVLEDLRVILKQNQKKILLANQEDLDNAEKNNKTKAFCDRLLLTPERLEQIDQSIKTVINLPDPIGEKFDEKLLSNGLNLYKMRVPIGVILIVYEARPNVTVDVFSLCLKSSNVCLLKGGSDSRFSNQALVEAISQALNKNQISEDFCQYLDLQKREELQSLLKQDKYVDLVIPRGGEGLIRAVVENSTIPVLKHDKGIDHIFVDKKADLKKAIAVCLNAKINRPSVCNAVDVLLVHQEIAEKFIPSMFSEYQKNKVEIRGCEKTKAIYPQIKKATEQDWDTEFLELIVGIKVVENIQEAIDFINKHGSQHTEAIMTEDKKSADEFIKKVDASSVFVNASTRLSDGGIFGLGMEMGISTQKIHARGPMGLRELTIYKWIGEGSGQIRE